MAVSFDGKRIEVTSISAWTFSFFFFSNNFAYDFSIRDRPRIVVPSSAKYSPFSVQWAANPAASPVV